MGEYWANPGDQPNYPILCTVRDVYNRFLSGFDQLCKVYVHTGTLDEFIEKTANNPYWNPHVTPQTHYLDVVKPDIVINTNKISQYLGVDVKKNVAVKPKPELTRSQKNKIKLIYQADLDWLEYQKY
jgi:hypothetical protein